MTKKTFSLKKKDWIKDCYEFDSTEIMIPFRYLEATDLVKIAEILRDKCSYEYKNAKFDIKEIKGEIILKVK